MQEVSGEARFRSEAVRKNLLLRAGNYYPFNNTRASPDWRLRQNFPNMSICMRTHRAAYGLRAQYFSPAGGAPANDWDAKGSQKAGLRGASGWAMCGTAQKKGRLGRKLTPMTNGFFS